jgi:hypothetical protein
MPICQHSLTLLPGPVPQVSVVVELKVATPFGLIGTVVIFWTTATKLFCKWIKIMGISRLPGDPAKY